MAAFLPDSGFLGSSVLRFPMRPVGHFVSAGHVGHGPTGGPFLGVDTGVALALAGRGEPLHDAWTFALRGGFEFANGIAVSARYDDLGVMPRVSVPPSSPVQLASLSFRYSFPFIVPLPFVEAMVGPAFYDGSVSPAGAIGLGISIPIGRHVRLDAGARDWLIPVEGSLRQVITCEAGVAVGFASIGR